MKEKENKKVVVGLSGGVDSSVAAGLLKRRGYDPVGVFMYFWGEKNKCCGKQAEMRARKVCERQDIPFYVLDVREEFKEKIVDYFLESYKKGVTPNPCVVCNRRIKFEKLFKKMEQLGGDFLATGHYARQEGGKLYLPKDEEKDQTYFLWNLKEKQLKRTLFPLGNLTKKEVRQEAKEMDLPTASLDESQEVCFVPNGLKNFLKDHIDLKPGDIVNKKGEKLGTHKGLPVYTLGQRKGIGLSGGPYYVLKKRPEENELVVTKENQDLMEREVEFEKKKLPERVNYPLEVKAKIRYNAPRKKGVLKRGKFIFDEPQRAITPGQSIVFYLSDRLLGGAVIK